MTSSPTPTPPTSPFDERVDAFWRDFDETRGDDLVDEMQLIVDKSVGATASAALYELASVHDALGQEDDAIPLYESALASGLDAARYPQAVVQLASTYRNVGRLDDSVALLGTLDLSDSAVTDVVGIAPAAFLALSLHDAGRPTEALAQLLTAVAPTLPLYARSVTNYAALLEPPRNA